MTKPIRVQCFVDGFNLYHAVEKIGAPHLKWFDLRKLITAFTDPKTHTLNEVFYFSAYATWRAVSYARHQQYVAALQVTGVTPIMGRFKEKDMYCRTCKSPYKAHEEKETDVNIALWLLNEAYQDNFDEAFIVSRDSDLTPAIRMVRTSFPEKSIKVISPPNAGHSKEIGQLVGRKKLASIKQVHLERCLLGATVVDPVTGLVVARRPHAYDPPQPKALPAK
ncbi:NYN domain-containing protein [Paracoccus litorisediminis]|uniref:NYN domain-containing protein n=1 Tax=Paracoccus litorisediminis TaxID=2006130 RepID=A0A844HKN3_9RHOB|nr:NYN domain-containing protein [Paracoccus litorisediminis]MTH58994.1 NYN domain-containing protein [Paracoccus litorisediminis]